MHPMQDAKRQGEAMAIERNNLRTVMGQDGAAILNMDRDLIATLNPTGALVWERLEQGDSLETVVANLASETGEEVLIVEKDVHTFVESLRENHLLPH
jgi:hypothetical protein